MEGISSFEMCNIADIPVVIIPPFLFFSDFENPMWSTAFKASGGTRIGFNYFPVSFFAAEDVDLLGVMADPDQEPGLAPVLVGKSELL